MGKEPLWVAFMRAFNTDQKPVKKSEEPTVSATKLTFYFADRDENNQPVEVEHHIVACVTALRLMNRGVTRLPPARGQWVTKNGTVVDDTTTIIYSYVFNEDAFLEQIDLLVNVLEEYGEETRQETLLMEFSAPDPEKGNQFHSYAIFLPTRRQSTD